MDDGVFWIYFFDGLNNFEYFSLFWVLNVYDNYYGGIWYIKISFDDKYVFMVGLDGNFFVFCFMDEVVKGFKVLYKVFILLVKVR